MVYFHWASCSSRYKLVLIVPNEQILFEWDFGKNNDKLRWWGCRASRIEQSKPLPESCAVGTQKKLIKSVDFSQFFEEQLFSRICKGEPTSKWTASKFFTIEQQKQNGSNIFVRPRKNQDGWDTEQKKLKNFNNNVNSNIVRGRCCVHSNETNIICLFWQILQRPAQFYKDIVAVGQGLLWPQLNVQDL